MLHYFTTTADSWVPSTLSSRYSTVRAQKIVEDRQESIRVTIISLSLPCWSFVGYCPYSPHTSVVVHILQFYCVLYIAAGKRIESEMRKSRRTTSAPMWRNFGFLLGSSCGHLILFKHNLVIYYRVVGTHIPHLVK